MTVRYWLRSASWDGFWILSGLWLLPIGVFFYFSPWLDPFSTYLMLAGPLIGGMHSFLPLIATFSSPSYHERIRESKTKIVGMSLVIVTASMALGLLGGVLAKPEFWLILGYGYLLWNTWHFSAQNFGVLSLYRHRADQKGDWDKKIDKWFSLTMGCVLQPIIWLCVMVRFGPLLQYVPSQFPGALIAQVTVGIATLLTVLYIAYEVRKPRWSGPKILYALSMGVQPWAGLWDYFVFHFMLYSIPHWMVEIGITGTIQARDSRRTEAVKTIGIFGAIVATGVALIFLLEPPWLQDVGVFAWWDQLGYGEPGVEISNFQLTIPMFLSLLFVPRSFFHFYISRQVFKSTRWTLSKLNEPKAS